MTEGPDAEQSEEGRVGGGEEGGQNEGILKRDGEDKWTRRRMNKAENEDEWESDIKHEGAN